MIDNSTDALDPKFGLLKHVLITIFSPLYIYGTVNVWVFIPVMGVY